MAVSQKIISANAQPSGGRAIVGINGARGLDSSSVLDSKHVLDPSVVAAANIDQSIAAIDASLDARYDDPRYYTGDSTS